MFIIKLLLVISVLILYSFFAKSCLKLLNIPTTVRSVAVFVISGILAGVISLVTYGAMMAEEQGHLGDEPQLLSMFSVSVLIAIGVSLGFTKIVFMNGRR